MSLNERCLELKEELKKYIKPTGISLLSEQSDFEKLLDFSKNYQLMTIDGTKTFFYKELLEYSVPLKRKVETFALYTKDVLRDKDNHYLSIIEVDSRGNTKIKQENIVPFFIKYRLADFKDGLDFIITEEPIVHNKINLWRGFNSIEETATEDDIKPFLDLLRINIASENQDQYEYALKYLAHMLLKPWELPRVAMVMPGKPGIGKDSILEIVSRWVNPLNYIKLTSTKDLEGFNKLLEAKLVIFADEATFAYDKSTAGVIKNLITSSTHLIERKNIDKYPVNNFARMIIASNNKDEAALIENGDRRYFVFDTQEKLDREFFNNFYYEVDKNNLAGKVMYWLKHNVDVSNVNFERDMPKTKSHAQIQSDKLPELLRFIIALANGDYSHNGLVFKYSKNDDDYVMEVEGNTLFDYFKMDYRQKERTVLDKNKFGSMLKDYIPSRKSSTVKYIFRIKEICNLITKETKTHIHSEEIMKNYQDKVSFSLPTK